MNLSAHKRLHALPDVFTTKTLAAHLGGDERMASVYLYRWRKEGFIKTIGLRAGLHFNLVKNPFSERDMKMDAIAFLFPGAVIGGVSAVHAAGWTTQIPRRTEIIAPLRRSFPEIEDCVLSSRSRQWFKLARDNIALPGVVPTVKPCFALADLWVSGEWRPDPEDIEWDLVDPQSLKQAFSLFQAGIPENWKEELEDIEASFNI